MSGSPYTPEDLVYIQGRSVCYSAIDKIHAEMWGLRCRLHMTEDDLSRARRWAWRWFLAALAGWTVAAKLDERPATGGKLIVMRRAV